VAPGLGSTDGRAALVVVDLERDLPEAVEETTLAAVEERLRAVAADLPPGGEVLVGGSTVVQRELQEQSEADLRRGELVALPIVLVVMVVVFGGVVAAGLPLLAALGAVAGGLATLYAASYVIDLDPGVPSVTTVLGLGLCVDYGLLLLSRYREERGAGRAPEDAVVATMRTAGRTITFSALTVAVSLSGLFLFELAVFQGLAVAGAAAVAFALLAALTLVPALIGLLQRRLRTPTRPLPTDGRFAALARATQRRPWLVVTGVGGLLLLLGSPFLHVEFQNGSTELLPASSESRRAAEAVAERFPGRGAEPVLVLGDAGVGALSAYADRLRTDPGVAGLVAAVGEPEERRDGYALLSIVPRGDSQGEQARALVDVLRADRPPGTSWVTGDAAALVDFQESILSTLPEAAAWLAGATLVLLFLMTGSVLVPLKALVMNVVSLGATFGALVWIFQDGHLSGLLNFTPVDGLETWVPVVCFAFAFGLSMDYEVFLLARVKELYDAGLPNDRAVEVGLQRSGRIITSAALVLLVVCLGFATGELLSIKQLGVALAVAVAVDATLVRCLLVPATMTLLGDRNWWAPAPLRRLHARLGLHEAPAPAPRGGADVLAPAGVGRAPTAGDPA
jgi:RND superfamily putative drug exporter